MEPERNRTPIMPLEHAGCDCMSDSSGRKKLERIKFVGVEFDYGKYHDGEDMVNDALGSGYVVIDHHQTGSGIVVIMGLYGGGKKL